MAAGAVIIAYMRVTRVSPTIGGMAGCTLVVVVIPGGWRMAAQAILPGRIVAETVLVPIAGIVTGRTLPDLVSRRRCVTAAAIRSAAVRVGGLFPTVRCVTIGTLTEVVIYRALVADFTIVKLAVLDGISPCIGVVAQIAGGIIMVSRRGVAGDTIRRGAVIDRYTTPFFGVMTSGALLRGMPLRRRMAGLAVGVVGVIEFGHQPVFDLVTVSADTRIVVLGGIRGMAIGALPVEFMAVISIIPISAGFMAAAAILTIVIVGRFLLVALQTLIGRESSMVKFGIRPGIGAVAITARA